MYIGIKTTDPDIVEFFQGFMGNKNKLVTDSLKYLIKNKRIYDVVLVSKNGGFSEHYRANHPADFNNGVLLVTDEELPKVEQIVTPKEERIEPETVSSAEDRLNEAQERTTVRPQIVRGESQKPLSSDTNAVFDY